MNNNPYATLGVKKTATAEEIKKSYRKIARTSHPDLNPDDTSAEERFKEASAAYDILKDPETRGRFDRGEIDATGAERHDRQFYREHAEASDNPYRSNQQYEGFGDASDIFAEILRQRGQGGANNSSQGFNKRGQDRLYSLEVTFMDAANGGKTQITLPNGGILDVQIPQGIADGQKIRLRGKGGAGFEGGKAGDAIVTLSVRSHHIFRRDGNDIIITLPITLYEAVLGGKVEAPTIDGSVKLTIPKGASDGQLLRLRGRGVKPVGEATHGDQRVELRIMTPDKIDDGLKTFMESWRETNAYDPRKGFEV